MKDILLETLLIWPMPLVWLLGLGVVLRQRGRRISLLAAAGLIVSSLPVVGLIMEQPLTAVPRFELAAKVDAIIVPTAGIFDDMASNWWGEENTIRRVARGRQLQEQTGLPLYVAGGVAGTDEPAEAGVAAEVMGIPGQELRLEEGSRNTAEMGRNIAAMLELAPRVVVVTNRVHILRAAASLRRHGVEVMAAPVSGDDSAQQSGVWLFVPSVFGLRATSEALHEYVGIAWYLVRGHIRFRDLFS